MNKNAMNSGKSVDFAKSDNVYFAGIPVGEVKLVILNQSKYWFTLFTLPLDLSLRSASTSSLCIFCWYSCFQSLRGRGDRRKRLKKKHFGI